MLKNRVKTIMLLALFTSSMQAGVFTKIGNFLRTRPYSTATAFSLICTTCAIRTYQKLHTIKKASHAAAVLRRMPNQEANNIFITSTLGGNFTPEPRPDGTYVPKIVGLNEEVSAQYILREKLKCAGWTFATLSSLAGAIKYWKK